MAETSAQAGVETEDAAPEQPVQRRRPRKPKEPNWHEMVRVRNLTDRRISTKAGGIYPHGEGMMTRLDASRLHAYVEILE